MVKTDWDSEEGEALLCIGAMGMLGTLPEGGKELVRIRGWTDGRDILLEKGKPKPAWSWIW